MSRTKRKASALDELNSGRVKSLQNYKDARDKSGEELWADAFEAQGDKILLDGDAARTRLGDFEDDTEEILPLKLRQRQHDDDQDESEVSEQEPPAKKPRHRQSGHEPLPTTKPGRFARPDPTEQDRLDRISDSEDSSDESVDEGDRVESWGKQYHVSRREMEAGPSTRKPSKKGKHADEDDGVDELREALTIQYTQKSQLAPEDFGELSDATESEPEDADAPVEQPAQVFENREQAIAHLLSTQPYLLSLLTDYAALTELLPDIKRRVAAHMLTPGMHPASKGLASFQLDLVEAYLTVCAFYLSLVARGLANSDLSEEALLRLTALREQIQNLEEAGISLDNVEEEEAQSDADGNPTKEELLQMLVDQNDLIKRMQAEGVADDSEPESELEDSAGSDGDFDPEAEFDDGVAVEIKKQPKQPKAAGPKKERKPRHSAVQKRQKAALTPAKPSKPSTKAEKLGDDFLEAASLSRSDRDDKQAKKHSLRFHTSQISSKEKKRGQATQVRMAGGDDDVPFVSKEAQRREAQRKEAAQVAKELAAEAGKATSKAAEASVPEELAGASGYYDLVKSAKSEEREAKKQAYDEQLLADRAALNQVTETDGPRSVSYAILRNKGLTPKRNKLNRNPRAKKRARYEAAKKKIGSMKSVYKADAAAQGRQAYQGEKSGIGMKTVKSRKL